MIGIAGAHGRTFRLIRDFLISAGWEPGELVEINHPNDASAVRQVGGLVVHIEKGARPHFEGHITSAKLECEVGDFVLVDADLPGEYLPRLVGRLSGLLERDHLERWRPRCLFQSPEAKEAQRQAALGVFQTAVDE